MEITLRASCRTVPKPDAAANDAIAIIAFQARHIKKLYPQHAVVHALRNTNVRYLSNYEL